MVRAFSERVVEHTARLDDSLGRGGGRRPDLSAPAGRAGRAAADRRAGRAVLRDAGGGRQRDDDVSDRQRPARHGPRARGDRPRAGRPVVGRHLHRGGRTVSPGRSACSVSRHATSRSTAPTSRKEWVALFFGSANHDRRSFRNPKRLDLDRPNIRQQHGLRPWTALLPGRPAGSAMCSLSSTPSRICYPTIGLSEELGVRADRKPAHHGFVRSALQPA